MKRLHCRCGKTMSIRATECNACYKAKCEKRIAEAKAIVATGKCPTCGMPLKRNNSMTGWYQCSQLGAEGFRADPSKPSCSFQTFTV